MSQVSYGVPAGGNVVLAQRRPHHKVRTGCQACKARRQKVDDPNCQDFEVDNHSATSKSLTAEAAAGIPLLVIIFLLGRRGGKSPENSP